MEQFISQYSVQMMQAIRLLLSCACGFAIGFERQYHIRAEHRKSAGLRTHMMVCLASATMMLVSKYGFFDVLSYGDNVRVDVSRVAAAIVSGVGFLGAGIIYVRKESIKGLTTAAGLWATSAVGMAIGCGMYFAGIVLTIFVLCIQKISAIRFYKSIKESVETVVVETVDAPDVLEQIVSWMKQQGISVYGISGSKSSKHGRKLTIQVDLKGVDKTRLLSMLDELESVEQIDL